MNCDRRPRRRRNSECIRHTQMWAWRR